MTERLENANRIYEVIIMRLIAQTKLREGRNEALIQIIINQSKVSHEMYGTEILEFDKLYKIPYTELRNIETEQRIQIGIKRNFAFNVGRY